MAGILWDAGIGALAKQASQEAWSAALRTHLLGCALYDNDVVGLRRQHGKQRGRHTGWHLQCDGGRHVHLGLR